MEIIFKSGELSMKQMYDLTRSPKIEAMKTATGTDIKVGAYLQYSDVNSKGETQLVTSVEEAETGVVYATNSPIFGKEFEMLVAMCGEAGEDLHTIEVVGGVSKTGRNFITCAYID